jgi:hypothetical protein
MVDARRDLAGATGAAAAAVEAAGFLLKLGRGALVLVVVDPPKNDMSDERPA